MHMEKKSEKRKSRREALRQLKEHAKFYFDQGNYDACLRLCEQRLLEGDDRAGYFMQLLAMSLMKKGHYFMALEYFERLVVERKRMYYNLVFIGDILYELERYDHAHEAYLAFLQTESNAPSVMEKCARCLFRMERMDEAFACIENAIALDPEAPEPLLTKAQLLRLSGKEHEAYALFAHIKRNFPESRHADEQLFEMLMEQLGSLRA